MYCLIQFYVQIRKDIQEHKPFLKILSIKLVIFLSFWQSILISLLVSLGAIGETKQLAMADLKYGLPEVLINIEMFIFSILHLWAFSWKKYVLNNEGAEVTDFYGNGKASYEGGRLGFGALGDAMNPLDLLKAIGRSFRWLAVGRKNRMQDPSYQPHIETIGLEAPEAGITTNNNTAYGGAGTAMAGGRTGRYASDEEGQVLLSHAQSNPSTTHVDASPWEDDSDDYLQAQQQSGRFYGHQNASPYDAIEHQNTAYPSREQVAHPYPADGPLREEAPMPMPDPYQPPPPYPEGYRHP